MAHVTDAHIQLYPVVHDVCILLHRCALFRLVTDVIIKHVVMQSPVWSCGLVMTALAIIFCPVVSIFLLLSLFLIA